MQEEKEQFYLSPRKTSKWAFLSLICGILSIFPGFYTILPYIFFRFGFLPYSPFSILAIAFGITGLKKKENRSLSIIGIILGSIGLIYLFWIFLATTFWGLGR